MMGNEQMVQDMIRTSRELLDACQKLDDAGVAKAKSEHRYRHATSVAGVKLAGVGKNVEERKSRIYLEVVDDQDGVPVTVGDLRFHRDLDEASAVGYLERVRSLRGILSAFQTQANALREELRLANSGPGMEP